jgi:hypothetical protein
MASEQKGKKSDPFYSDDARKAVVNAAARRPWIQRRPEWIRRIKGWLGRKGPAAK